MPVLLVPHWHCCPVDIEVNFSAQCLVSLACEGGSCGPLVLTLHPGVWFPLPENVDHLTLYPSAWPFGSLTPHPSA